VAFSRLAEEAVDFLAAQGHGTKGTDLFIGIRPPTPAAVVSVTQFGGEPPDSYLPFVEQVALQVMSRAATSKDAEEKAYDIFEELHGKGNLTWASHGIMTITAIASPGYVGREQLEGPDAYLWSCNYIVALRRETS